MSDTARTIAADALSWSILSASLIERDSSKPLFQTVAVYADLC